MSYSPDIIQYSAHISSSRIPNELILVLLEIWDKFPKLSWRLYIQIMVLAMMFCSDKKIMIVTKSRGGHPLNN